MATSLLDYVFRELAVSYLGRNDLAHVQPEDLRVDALGGGAIERGAAHDPDDEEEIEAQLSRMAEERAKTLASNGYVRSNLYVLNAPRGQVAATTVTAGLELAVAGGGTSFAYAGVTETAIQLGSDVRLDRVREARIKGYEGDACGECGNFTLVRNGTCMKCNTCGSTSGCS